GSAHELERQPGRISFPAPYNIYDVVLQAKAHVTSWSASPADGSPAESRFPLHRTLTSLVTSGFS
ncbi:MAG: hypothetical protein RI841_15790, partial [Halomonas sp.]|uniref:hypothetical protein n=1 Tax=Halomonas sp. TaxID=1486246 RepID=UPI0028707BFC